MVEAYPVEELKKSLAYCPNTGVFRWKKRDKVTYKAKPGKVAGYLHKNGYYYIQLDRIKFSAHRVAWALSFGKWPSGVIDHIDGNRSNNKLSNLRDISTEENRANISRLSNNKSGHKNISWKPSHGKWWVRVSHKGKQSLLGYFDDLEKAVEARDKFRSSIGIGLIRHD